MSKFGNSKFDVNEDFHKEETASGERTRSPGQLPRGDEMNLASCDGCGVVLDLNKLGFPYPIEDDNGYTDTTKGVWSDFMEGFVAFVPCPVCRHDVKDERK